MNAFSGPPPRRLKGRELVAWYAGQARQARDSVADAFYRMDMAQRDTRLKVDAFVNLEAGSPAATSTKQQFDVVNARADALSMRYIDVLDANPVDDGLTPQQYSDAGNALTAIARELDASSAELTAFADRFAGQLDRVEQALSQVGPKAAAAHQAVSDARAAIGAVRAQGMSTARADESFAAAQAAEAELDQGAAKLGIGNALRKADEVRVLAERAKAVAEALPRKRTEVTHRLTSLRTRRDALDTQATRVPDQFRRLRREYVEGCWVDLEDNEKDIETSLQAADRAFDAASTDARHGDWDAAAESVTRAGALMEAAHTRISAVEGRIETLDEVRADPRAPVAQARFAIRDAQRLVMAGRTVAPAPWGAALDGLAARLDQAPAGLERPHPDYWAYLSVLHRIQDETADLVRRFRAAKP
ncbi:MAG: hypothetical protein ACRDP1_06030 [Nocardioidaceae bacterium]